MNIPPLAAICFAPRPAMRAVLESAARPASVSIVIAAMLSFSLRDFDVQGLAEAQQALGLSTVLLLAPLVLAFISLFGIAFYFMVSGARRSGSRRREAWRISCSRSCFPLWRCSS